MRAKFRSSRSILSRDKLLSLLLLSSVVLWAQAGNLRWSSSRFIESSQVPDSDDNRAPQPLKLVGETEKVCQLTGDVDWETSRQTAARTFSNFGLDACDLGYPIEHNGKLILLFGDSWPPPHGGGPAGEVPPDDAVGVTTRQSPPNRDDGKCLALEVHHAGRRFSPATITGPTRVKQGLFNVPSGGVSVEGALYAFFWTDHCAQPSDLSRTPDEPLARPRPSQACPETDDRNSIGRSVLARSDDEGRTFSHVVQMPTGFNYVGAVNAAPFPELSQDQMRGVFIFGVPRYRASVPYLARATIETFTNPRSWQFFIGLNDEGKPKWASFAEWVNGRPSPLALGIHTSEQSWNPPGQPELFRPRIEQGRSVGELSVTWNRVLHRWLMLYGGPGGILVRVARAPWGPWSDATRVLGDDPWLNCRLLMRPDGCGKRRDYWPNDHKSGKFVAGGLYAPYILDRYTTATEADTRDGQTCTIYWVVSTWNPYQVAVMRTTLRSADSNSDDRR